MLDNLFGITGLIKNKNGTGIFIGRKTSKTGNYINVSEYFTSVTSAVFCGWVSSGEENYICFYQDTDSNLNVKYYSLRFSTSGVFMSHNYSATTKDEGTFGSCTYVITGILK